MTPIFRVFASEPDAYVVASHLFARPVASFPFTEAGQAAAEAFAKGMTFRSAMNAVLASISAPSPPTAEPTAARPTPPNPGRAANLSHRSAA